MILNKEILWDYADDFLTAAEMQEVKTLLAQQPEWQTELESILAEKSLFAQTPLFSPDANFSSQVLEAFQSTQVVYEAPKYKVLNWLFFAFILLNVLLFAAVFSGNNSATSEPLIINVPSFDVSNAIITPLFALLFGVVLMKFVERIVDFQQEKMLLN